MIYEGKMYCWFDSFETFHQKYIIIPTECSNYSVPEESIHTAVMTPPGFIDKKVKQYIISMQPSKFYTKMLFLDDL